MRALAPLLIAGALGCVGPLEPDGANPPARAPIVNGEVDIFDRGVVALLRQGFNFCTGTLVSPRVVVTAAHCVDSVADFSELSVHIGERVGQGESIRVELGSLHDEYTGQSHDIAMLLLERPAPARYWPASATAFDDSFVGRDVRIVGFGATDPDGSGDGRRREGTAAITFYNELDFNYASNPSQTCFGDSGGPAFLTIDGVEYLAGVTSRGDAECAERGINTRVDVYTGYVYGFIALHDPEPPACDADGLCAIDCDAADPDCPCETDGFCDAACDTLATDRDCPANCDYDGVCQEAAECPVVDRDCTPTAAVGDSCEFDTTCLDGTCVAATDDERITYCSVPCGGDGDCPGAMVCDGQPALCRHLPPSPGAQGWPCEVDGECRGDHCIAGGCSEPCADNRQCSEGYVCKSSAAAGGERVCLARDEGGCRAGGVPSGAAGALLVLVLAASARRQRRRAAPARHHG